MTRKETLKNKIVMIGSGKSAPFYLLTEKKEVLIDGNIGNYNKGFCTVYNPLSQTLSMSLMLAEESIENTKKIGTLSDSVPYPSTNRTIPFLATNIDGSLTTAELNIAPNGEIRLYNSENKVMKNIVINGKCFLGKY